jgi:hypothetical protein
MMLRANVTSPSFPARMNSAAAARAPLERFCVPAWQSRPVFSATCTIRRPSETLWLTGFSTYTCLPACMAQIAASACQWFGAAIETVSTDLSSKIARKSWTAFGRRPRAFSTEAASSSASRRSGSQT